MGDRQIKGENVQDKRLKVQISSDTASTKLTKLQFLLTLFGICVVFFFGGSFSSFFSSSENTA